MKPMNKTKMIFFSFRLDFYELDDVVPETVVLGIDEYFWISSSRFFYFYTKIYYTIFLLFDHHSKI